MHKINATKYTINLKKTAFCQTNDYNSKNRIPHTAGSRFAAVRFRTIQLYDPCRGGPSTPDLRCITVATQPSSLYALHFQLYNITHCTSAQSLLLKGNYKATCFDNRLVNFRPILSTVSQDAMHILGSHRVYIHGIRRIK